VKPPEVLYARSGDVNIAYSTVGDGAFDLFYAPGSVMSMLDIAWDGPPGDVLAMLGSFCRLIIFDKRGTGLSDRVDGFPLLETRMDDVRAVMDAAGSHRAGIMGFSEGGPMTALFAATYPERTAAAIFYGTRATFTRADDYPWSPPRDEALASIEATRNRPWTDERLRKMIVRFLGETELTPELWQWWRRYVRSSASPGAAYALNRMNLDIDVRHVLPLVGAPTLVLHAEFDPMFDLDEGRYIASKVPGAELVVLPGSHHAWFVEPEPFVREVRSFLEGIWNRGEWDEVEAERVLATVVFTDIVGSTERAAAVGDRAWRETLLEHHVRVRRQLVRFRGTEVDTAGDGFFARFDGPARAIRCASAISESVRELGLEVRAGVHTGECEIVDGKVGGIAVHIGARVAAHADPGEVLVSQTVKDLVSGSGIEFTERGATELKGVPGEWRLYAVA
jgi:pimeloyl-ACP methyl ester carboxylesterase/class 3 adenylate cyclase